MGVSGREYHRSKVGIMKVTYKQFKSAKKARSEAKKLAKTTNKTIVQVGKKMVSF